MKLVNLPDLLTFASRDERDLVQSSIPSVESSIMQLDTGKYASGYASEYGSRSAITPHY